jgi:hypothetical protein
MIIELSRGAFERRAIGQDGTQWQLHFWQHSEGSRGPHPYYAFTTDISRAEARRLLLSALTNAEAQDNLDRRWKTAPKTEDGQFRANKIRAALAILDDVKATAVPGTVVTMIDICWREADNDDPQNFSTSS